MEDGNKGSIGVDSTIYEIRNIITCNSKNQFFEMINRDEGKWWGYAQGNCFDDNPGFTLDYKIPDNKSQVISMEEACNNPNTCMNYFFVELNPLVVIYMKKDPFDKSSAKYKGEI